MDAQPDVSAGVRALVAPAILGVDVILSMNVSSSR